ncbi:hypothetical protein CHELA1G11_70024 [Hyphomicrobiales bacterium]|nr:hypothetical protein CHELA1G2_60010 [Hyphomicrobiales bacterium]CAH1696918.1 hypothetical protein CHELA1G11_70024 [Hyphomicrobiales bacterium]
MLKRVEAHSRLIAVDTILWQIGTWIGARRFLVSTTEEEMFTPKVATITVSAEHVKEAEARCARQRDFIRELRASGQPTATAEAILDSMQSCLARVREAVASQSKERI